MIRLSTLGRIDLRAPDGRAIGSILHQPKRLALLTYLALESRGGAVRRDALLAVFWPEMETTAGRRALSQALYFLRQSLGEAVLPVGDPEEVALAAEALWCDAAEFLRALDEGRPEEAMRLYGGELLPAFFAADSAELEQWLDGARNRLRRGAAEASWMLAERDARGGNAVGAGAWARRAAELCPRDEAALRRTLELLEGVGDRAGALQAYQAFARELDEEYGAAPAPETRALANRLRAPAGNGVRSDPPDLPHSSAAAAPRLPTLAAAKPSRRWSPLARRAASAAVTLLLVAAFSSLWGPGTTASRTAAATVTPRVLVSPIEAFGGSGADGRLGEAIAAELVRLLGRGDGIEVQAASASPAIVAAAADREPTAIRPTFVLRAGYFQAGDTLRVSATLLDAGTGLATASTTADHAHAGGLGVPIAVAAELETFVRRSLGRAVQEQKWSRGTEDSRAITRLKLAEADRQRADSLRRAGLLPAALAAYAAADSLFALAEASNPEWNEPRVQRAETALGWVWLYLRGPNPRLDLVRAAASRGLAHADRAVQHGADDAAAWEIRGILRQWLWRTAPPDSLDRSGETVARIERDFRQAVSLDPTRARAWSFLSALLIDRGAFGEAYWAAENALKADRYLEDVSNVLARLYQAAVENRDMASAERWCAELTREHGSAPICLHCRLDLLAWQDSVGPEEVAGSRALLDAAASAEPAYPRLQMLHAVVLARAGRSASARALADTARAGGTGDPELLHLEAWLRTVLGEHHAAAVLLDRYAELSPRAAGGVLRSRRFRSAALATACDAGGPAATPHGRPPVCP